MYESGTYCTKIVCAGMQIRGWISIMALHGEKTSVCKSELCSGECCTSVQELPKHNDSQDWYDCRGSQSCYGYICIRQASKCMGSHFLLYYILIRLIVTEHVKARPGIRKARPRPE